MRELDSIDRRILRALQENGRIQNVEPAEKVGLSPSPCLRRLPQAVECHLSDVGAAPVSGWRAPADEPGRATLDLVVRMDGTTYPDFSPAGAGR